MGGKPSHLYEGKQVGPIYHFTTLHNAWGIISDGVLKPKGKGGFEFNGDSFVIDRPRDWVSFTRNPSLKVTPATGAVSRSGEMWAEVRIDFDGDKLSNRNRIEPYHDDDGSLTRHDAQAEERVVGEVDARKAITGVVFYYDIWMRNETDYDSWVSEPDQEQKEKYAAQARKDAAMFLRFCKNQGLSVKIMKGLPK